MADIERFKQGAIYGLSAWTKKVAVSGVSTVALSSTFINSRTGHLQEL